MKIIIMAIVIIISLSTGAIPTLSQGKLFSPENQSFSIEMPSAPECNSNPIDLFGEKIHLNICIYSNEPAQLFYSLTYFNRLNSTLDVDQKVVLRAARDGALVMSNSRLISESEITVDGYFGLECVERANDIELQSITRYVITDRQIIFADISGQPGKIPDRLARTYLDSLRFSNKKNE
jgi:hypothetical protein